MVIIEAILNRLRGTGVIKHFGTLIVEEIKLWKLTVPKIEVEVKLVWNHVYGLYLGMIVGLLAMNVWAGLAVLAAYLVGESKGWGEWVGALTRWETKDEKWLQRQYKDNEGVGFPYVHQIANFVIKEQVEGALEEKLEQYHKYATVALTLRGVYWWSLVYGVIAWFGLINLYEYAAIIAILGFGFPIACEIGKMIKSNGKIWKIEWSQGWENQELIYGFVQGICLWYVVISNIIT